MKSIKRLFVVKEAGMFASVDQAADGDSGMGSAAQGGEDTPLYIYKMQLESTTAGAYEIYLATHKKNDKKILHDMEESYGGGELAKDREAGRDADWARGPGKTSGLPRPKSDSQTTIKSLEFETTKKLSDFKKGSKVRTALEQFLADDDDIRFWGKVGVGHNRNKMRGEGWIKIEADDIGIDDGSGMSFD